MKFDTDFTEYKILPEGQYYFRITSAEEKVSNKGNDMIELQLHIISGDGGENMVRDWLVGSEKAKNKILSFCKSTGMEEKARSGELSPGDCLNRCGSCALMIDEWENEKGEKRSSNKVKFYTQKSDSEKRFLELESRAGIQSHSGGQKGDDNVPF